MVHLLSEIATIFVCDLYFCVWQRSCIVIRYLFTNTGSSPLNTDGDMCASVFCLWLCMVLTYRNNFSRWKWIDCSIWLNVNVTFHMWFHPRLTWAEKSMSLGNGTWLPSLLFRKSSKLPEIEIFTQGSVTLGSETWKLKAF